MSEDQISFARYEIGWAVEALARVRRGPHRALVHLADLRYADEVLVRARRRMVVGARRQGASWGQIGAALGVTPQAVRQAFLREVERAERRAADWTRYSLSQTAAGHPDARKVHGVAGRGLRRRQRGDAS